MRAVLDELIRELRSELEAEIPLKLHAGAPAGGRHTRGGAAEGEESTGQPVERRMQHGPGFIGETGLPFSRQFDRYLNSHGGDFLAADSFTEIRDHCRRSHWREQHTGDNPYAWNLCARLAIAAVELRQPLPFIADAEGIDVWLARNLLTAALEHARQWRRDRRAGIIIADESRLQLDVAEALPVVLAREHSLSQERKVWDLWRERFPYLPDWDTEAKRRRAYHAAHCYQGCPLLREEAA